MTTEREFDRIAMAWLADGPAELSDRVLDAVVDEIHVTRQRRAPRVPWRFPTMTMPARVAAIIAVGALILAGAAVIGGAGRSGPSPTQAPAPSAAAVVASTSPSPSVLSTHGIPVLDTVFTSPRNGYSVKVPSAWTVAPATKSWQHGTPILWGDPTLDAIQTTDARFVAAAQPLALGETADEWLKAYCLESANDIGQCDTVPASWEEIKIAGSKAYVDIDGIPAAGGTIAPGGKIFDAVAVVGNGAYAFTLDGDVDRAMLDAFLATVQMSPAAVISLPELTGTFTSPTYGYSIGVADDWTTKAGTKTWDLTDDTAPMIDEFEITGTDTSLNATSGPLLARDLKFDTWLVNFHLDALGNVPAGCDGGDVATWPTVQIGDQVGRIRQLCNAANAVVLVDGRVYEFGWYNSTFAGGDHMNEASWKELLKTVTFDSAAAK